jgi:AhpD family alkylhydroperoxidase
MTQASPCFDKPVWTRETLFHALAQLPLHLARTASTLYGRPISNALRERIMLAVAAENRCRYCQLAHRIIGEAAGHTAEQIADTLAGDDSHLSEGEALVLTFVRDLARRGFLSRDEHLYQELGRHFSDEERQAIESSAHLMNFANRFGNTFDAGLALAGGRCLGEKLRTVDLVAISSAFLAVALPLVPLLGVVKALQVMNPLHR